MFSSSRTAAGFKIYKMNATDGSNVTQVTTDSFSFDGSRAGRPTESGSRSPQPAHLDRSSRRHRSHPGYAGWGSSAHAGLGAERGRIAYTVQLGDGPPWSEIHTIEPDGSNDLDLGDAFTDTTSDPAWSPDGSQIAFRGGTGIGRMNADGSGTPVEVTSPSNSGPDWQPLPFPGYPRPVAASPIRASLVPGLRQSCTHRQPHARPTAGLWIVQSAGEASRHLTVGTPDANGAAANSVGFLKMRVAPGAPGPPTDTQVWIDYSISDVRCDGTTTTCGNANTTGGADYAGELEGRFTLRSTDKHNGPGPNEPATMTEYTFRWTAPCSQTAVPPPARSCNMNNLSMDAVVPGIVLNLEGKRAIWEIDQVGFYDGGADGDADTPGDNSRFATQGVFVP